METEYEVNISALKDFYKPTYLEIDATKFSQD